MQKGEVSTWDSGPYGTWRGGAGAPTFGVGRIRRHDLCLSPGWLGDGGEDNAMIVKMMMTMMMTMMVMFFFLRFCVFLRLLRLLRFFCGKNFSAHHRPAIPEK